jgi:hypothetical protein
MRLSALADALLAAASISDALARTEDREAEEAAASMLVEIADSVVEDMALTARFSSTQRTSCGTAKSQTVNSDEAVFYICVRCLLLHEPF